MIDFTTVVAVDAAHLAELKIVWPTWKRLRAELLQRPMLLLCDATTRPGRWMRLLEFLDHPQRRLVMWDLPGAEQREKMLNALVLATAREVQTPWYLKLDTDTVALHPGDWAPDAWFAPDEGRLPVFVSQPWAYTKPPDAIVRLDAWGDTVGGLREHARLDLVPWPGWSMVRHRRIISWCFFGHTAWTRRMAALCDGRLPVPSQDTFLWYCAARRGEFYRRVSMTSAGWRHLHQRRSLIAAADYALQTAERD